MFRSLCTFLVFVVASPLFAQSPFSYLPADEVYDPSIPTPESVLGFPVGKWHASHDQLLRYYDALAAASPRVSVERIGRSHEDRPTQLVRITSPGNQAQLEQLRRAHLRHVEGQEVPPEALKLVVWQGYSIHGNESSGANAALLYAYHLAASKSPELAQTLDRTIVLIDPAFNPDGLTRFADWTNAHRSQSYAPDPANREFNETWPGGRTNHYWFDLNRDWLPAQQPESQGRLEAFHRWKPNVLTDHHEMGSNSTFFFQPGIPSRNNPLTPARTVSLTGELAKFHAAALDSIGSLYYSEESFDDFYYGKGSTYPDLNGAVGVLFEQASSRGSAQETQNGLLTFPFTIRNQLVTSLSTLYGADALREQFLDLQQSFFQNALREGRKDPRRAFVVGDGGDPMRLRLFARLLDRHQVAHFANSETFTRKGKRFDAQNSLIVPLDQPQYRLIRTIFETPTAFRDSLFYDVSAWTLPLAFNLPYAAMEAAFSPAGNRVTLAPPTGGISAASPYAYAFSWSGYFAPRVLAALQRAGVRCKMAEQGLGMASFDAPGTVVVPVSGQSVGAESLRALLDSLGRSLGIEIHALATGRNPDGIDLGSPKVVPLAATEVAVLVGSGVSGYDAGEMWHLLDLRYGAPPTLLSLDALAAVDLGRYDVIIMPEGSYYRVLDSEADALERWLRGGGTLIAERSALRWLTNREWTSWELRAGNSSPARAPFGQRDITRGATRLGGALFEVEVDLTHPLFFGYNTPKLPVFLSGTRYLTNVNGKPPAAFSTSPLLAGYAPRGFSERLAGATAVAVQRLGRGKIVGFGFDPNFRAFWLGTDKLLANAIWLRELY